MPILTGGCTSSALQAIHSCATTASATGASTSSAMASHPLHAALALPHRTSTFLQCISPFLDCIALFLPTPPRADYMSPISQRSRCSRGGGARLVHTGAIGGVPDLWTAGALAGHLQAAGSSFRYSLIPWEVPWDHLGQSDRLVHDHLASCNVHSPGTLPSRWQGRLQLPKLFEDWEAEALAIAAASEQDASRWHALTKERALVQKSPFAQGLLAACHRDVVLVAQVSVRPIHSSWCASRA